MTFFFLCNLIEGKKEVKNNSKEASLYRGSMVWSIKGKNGKRWNLGNIKWQHFFKVQGTAETTIKHMWKYFWLTFFLGNLIWEKKKKREEIKRRQYLRGRLVWSTKERMGKDRIQIKNDRTVFFFFLRYKLQMKQWPRTGEKILTCLFLV